MSVIAFKLLDLGSLADVSTSPGGCRVNSDVESTLNLESGRFHGVKLFDLSCDLEESEEDQLTEDFSLRERGKKGRKEAHLASLIGRQVVRDAQLTPEPLD